jgi:hypothetical protein
MRLPAADLLFSRGRRVLATAAFVASGLAVPLALPVLAGPPSQFRSLTDIQPRMPDEHDRPYFRETQSHRGWEIREPQFTVFAATSAEDARAAAGHVAQVWNRAAALAARWTDVPSNPDFGLSALQVVIDNEPLRDRDAPLTTVNVAGIQTQVQVHVAPGQPGFGQQIIRIREGAAFAALHAAGLDSAAPPWVVAGLAAYAGRAGLPPEQLPPAGQRTGGPNLGGQQWRFERSADDVLDYRHHDYHGGAEQVRFLLTGDDAQHAPEFIASLRQSTDAAAAAAAEGGAFVRIPGDSPRVQPSNSFDQQMNRLAAQFRAWKDNPLAGQPVFEPTKGTAPEILAAERDMLVLLKLHQRSARAGKTSRGVVTTPRANSRIKVVTLDRTSEPKGGATKRETPAASFAAFAGRLTDPALPVWGTIDVDGSLLLSTDTQRVNELLGGFDPQYTLERQGERTMLVRRLEGQRTLRGWLEENPKDKSRPIARFEVVDRRAKKSEPAAKDQRQARQMPRDS